MIDGCVELRPRSSEDFVESLRTARGVIMRRRPSLLSEAVYLGKPILAVPLHGQFEQLMNARYVERLGYGLCADGVDAEVLGGFIARLAEFEAALAGYKQSGNARTLAAISERAAAAAAAKPRELRRARRAAREAIAMSSAARRALGAAAMGGAAFAWYHGQIPTSQLYPDARSVASPMAAE